MAHGNATTPEAIKVQINDSALNPLGISQNRIAPIHGINNDVKNIPVLRLIKKLTTAQIPIISKKLEVIFPSYGLGLLTTQSRH